MERRDERDSRVGKGDAREEGSDARRAMSGGQPTGGSDSRVGKGDAREEGSDARRAMSGGEPAGGAVGA
ncbi:hypothetical protein T484DRAFT_1795134 [Baffinella frigidus]|nr:hypothetical protein T484DRAFT_1795134 [Cryptophyta sp. CCMP2293]